MRKWRLDVEHAQCGCDLQDGLSKLLDLRFAGDILFFVHVLCTKHFSFGKFDARICRSGSFAEW